MLDRAAVGVELLARLEDDGVQPALGVGELHPVPGHEGPVPELLRSCSMSTGAQGTDGVDVTRVPSAARTLGTVGRAT